MLREDPIIMRSDYIASLHSAGRTSVWPEMEQEASEPAHENAPADNQEEGDDGCDHQKSAHAVPTARRS